MMDGTGVTPAPGLGALIDDLRRIIADGRGCAAAAVNTEIVRTYWQIGERVMREEQGGADRAAYGEQVLEEIGRVLAAEHGRGFAARSLRNMRQFYLAYPKWSALRTELTWTHYRTLKRLSEEQRAFYGQVAAAGRWSSRELDKQLSSMLYERTALSRTPDALLAAIPRGETALAPHAGAFKDPYVLDFLGLDDTFSEKDLGAGLVRQMETFLIELGTGFYVGGRERRISIGGEDFDIDLKIGALSHADISQIGVLHYPSKRCVKAQHRQTRSGIEPAGAPVPPHRWVVAAW